MVNMLYLNHHAENDFESLNVEDKERRGQQKKFEDKELEELIDQDQCQTLQELSES